MSAIDWETKPEPWRTIGLQFINDLAEFETANPRPIPPAPYKKPKIKRIYRKWTSTDLRELFRLRDEEKLTWVEVASRLNRSSGNAQARYSTQRLREQP